MRLILALPLLLVAACSVDSDGRNDTVTVDFNDNAVEQTAEDLGNVAEGAASSVGNAASEAGTAIKDEVTNIDVDIDVDRNKQD